MNWIASHCASRKEELQGATEEIFKGKEGVGQGSHK